MLLTAGYQDLEELGAGAFGLVVKVKNQEGFKRALKIQLCGNAETDDEIEVGIPYKKIQYCAWQEIDNFFENFFL